MSFGSVTAANTDAMRPDTLAEAAENDYSRLPNLVSTDGAVEVIRLGFLALGA